MFGSKVAGKQIYVKLLQDTAQVFRRDREREVHCCRCCCGGRMRNLLCASIVIGSCICSRYESDLKNNWGVIFTLKNTRAQSAEESFCICADLTTITTLWQRSCDTILTKRLTCPAAVVSWTSHIKSYFQWIYINTQTCLYSKHCCHHTLSTNWLKGTKRTN